MNEIKLKPFDANALLRKIENDLICGSSAEIREMVMPDGGKCYVIPATIIGAPPKVGAVF